MELEEEVWSPRPNVGELKQVLATVVANISTLAVGVMLPMVVHYSKIDLIHTEMKIEYQDETKLNIFMIQIAVTLGLLFSYSFCEFYGRKITLCLSVIPLIICWVLVTFVEKPLWIKIAISLQVFGSSMCLLTLPLYVSEISCDSIRGALGGIRMIFMTVGSAIGHFITLDRTIQQAAYIVIFFPLIAIIGMHWIPESPVFLIRKSRLEEATRSLLWLKNNDGESARNELLRIEQTIQGVPNSGSCLGDGVETIKDLFRCPANRLNFFIALGLLTAQSMVGSEYSLGLLCGLIPRNYPIGVIIFFVIIPVLGSTLATILMDSVGRRRLLLISFIARLLLYVLILGASTIAYNVTGSDTILEWLQYALVCLMITTYYLGLGTIPCVIAVEVFPRKVLSSGYMICLVISWTVIFVNIWIHMLGILTNTLVHELCQLVFYVACSFFTYFLVPETKGKAIE